QSITCAILDDDTVKCWGIGPLGDKGPQPRMRPSSKPIDFQGEKVAHIEIAHSNFVCALLKDHNLKCWGSNDFGQLGYNDTQPREIPDSNAVNFKGLKVKQISLGRSHACALLEDQTLRCWGDNNHGRLGYSGPSSLQRPLTEPPINMIP
ncbi:MAG: hypothetical protein AAGJ35_05330, partial [Myxococcota bacterium]